MAARLSVPPGEPACGNCRFYQQDPNPDHASWGWCRRHAPPPLVWPSGKDEPTTQTLWPGVNETEWCGEYRAPLSGDDLPPPRLVE